MPRVSIQEELQRMSDSFERSASGLLKTTSVENLTFEKGKYRLLIAKPSKRLAGLLTVDRELAVLITSFTELQARTTRALRKAIDKSAGRLEATVAVVIHKDAKGDAKLKNWGRESGISILPVYFEESLPMGVSFERLLCYEMYSHDPFDITGPVSGDAHFFGRRSEAQDLARALQHRQIRSALGIRKIGKTSIINRVVTDIRENHKSLCIMVDCSKDQMWNMTASQLMSSRIIHQTVNRKREPSRDLPRLTGNQHKPTSTERITQWVKVKVTFLSRNSIALSKFKPPIIG